MAARKSIKVQAAGSLKPIAVGKFMLVPVDSATPTKTRAARQGEKASVLVAKAGQALDKPGIKKQVVFRQGAASGVYAYSVYPKDPTKVVREAADGTRKVGRMVGGKFRAIKTS